MLIPLILSGQIPLGASRTGVLVPLAQQEALFRAQMGRAAAVLLAFNNKGGTWPREVGWVLAGWFFDVFWLVSF